MNRIIDISNDGRHLSRFRGFMIISEDKTELGRVSLDDIFAVIVHANGVTYSNSLLAELARRGGLVVLCGSNHAPVALITALEGHHAQAGRIRAQINSTRPLMKQMWKHLVIAKVLMQAAALEAWGQSPERLRFLSRSVKSGDPQNIEAQAARLYWPLMMGESFRRDRAEPSVNGLLNYGYTVLRAAVARHVIGAGLHPSLGVHHQNKLNAFALADDLMEPFRPLVDCTVKGLIERGITDVTTDAKQTLARLITMDVDVDGSLAPLSSAIQTLCHSLAVSFEQGKAGLRLPQKPSMLALRSLGTPYDTI